MATIFSKIVSGEIPCYKVAETQDYIAFLDVRPIKRGHTLVIPKRETDYIFDLENEEFAGLHLFAKMVATGIKKAFPCKKVGVCVIGLEVPHAHIHLIPMDAVSEMNFANPKLEFPDEEMKEIAAKIAGEIG